MVKQGDFYRIVVENGKIRALFFDRGSSIPYTKIEGKITDPKIFELLCLLYQKAASPKDSIDEFTKIVNNYTKNIEEDFKFFLGHKDGNNQK